MKKILRNATAVALAMAIVGGALPTTIGGVELFKPALVAEAATDYGIKIVDTELTSDNLSKTIGNVTFSYAPDTNVLAISPSISGATLNFDDYYSDDVWSYITIKKDNLTVSFTDSIKLEGKYGIFNVYYADGVSFESLNGISTVKVHEGGHYSNGFDLRNSSITLKGYFNVEGTYGDDYHGNPFLLRYSKLTFDDADVSISVDNDSPISSYDTDVDNPKYEKSSVEFINCDFADNYYGGYTTDGYYQVFDNSNQSVTSCKIKKIQNKILGASVTLNSDFGLNYYAQLRTDVARADLNGPNGIITITNFTDLLQPNTSNTYKLSYPVNATQANETVSLKLYNSSNELLDIYNSSDEKDSDSTIEYSVQQYLNAATPESNWDNNKKKAFNNLIGTLKTYGAVSYAYFNGDAIPAVTDYKTTILTDNISPYPNRVPSNSMSNATISLVLNSKLAARLYIKDLTASETATYDGNTLTAKKGSDGRYYFEITDITPLQLGWKSYTDNERYFEIVYNNKNYEFTPMTWAYRVMNSDSAPEKDIAMANILYEYFKNVIIFEYPDEYTAN